MDKTKLTHASLFSGIGGAELAASWAGLENVFHCEINPFGRQVLNYWFPSSVSYDDITRTDFTQWRRRINVLTGGFPCQPFSMAGNRRGAGDDRYLWPQMLRAIREIEPDWVIGENVDGILSMVEPVEGVGVEGGAADVDAYLYTIERVCRDLEAAGLRRIYWRLMSAAICYPPRLARRCNTDGRRYGRGGGGYHRHTGGCHYPTY